jgi:hypothetical protein
MDAHPAQVFFMKHSLRQRLVWQCLGITLAAALVGALTARPLLRYLIDHRALHNGPWRTSASTGSANANPWERAAVALAGLYALTSQEAVYYTTFTDSEGRALRGSCEYRVLGQVPPARWWSLTVYGADHYLVPNAAGLYARHAGNLPLRPEGGLDIALSSQQESPGYLPIPQNDQFSLTLRLYNPAASVLEQLSAVALPAIHRERCA